jgi:hypothetical protein
VVAHKKRFGVSDHPVRSDQGGLRDIFLGVAASPRHEEGNMIDQSSSNSFTPIDAPYRSSFPL